MKERSWKISTVQSTLKKSTLSPGRGNIHIETGKPRHPKEPANVNYRRFPFRGAVGRVCTMGWRSGRSLSTTAIPTVGALSISSCAGAKRNETWRVCELRWSVAPNLSRPHLFSPETKIWSATTRVLRASIFTPPFSSAANPPPFRHRLVVSSFCI